MMVKVNGGFVLWYCIVLSLAMSQFLFVVVILIKIFITSIVLLEKRFNIKPVPSFSSGLGRFSC